MVNRGYFWLGVEAEEPDIALALRLAQPLRRRLNLCKALNNDPSQVIKQAIEANR